MEASCAFHDLKMAYVYARDGVPLEPIQTLGWTVDSNHFHDAMPFQGAATVSVKTSPSLVRQARRQHCRFGAADGINRRANS
jgi:uncharacterized membrane protein YqiK